MDDVATAAGVSTATVSRALNGLPMVTPATREAVLAAAERLGYLPDPHAARLAAGRSGTIGILVPVLDQWFFGKATAAIEGTLASHGFEVLRYTLASVENRKELFERKLSPKRLDGLITVSLPLQPEEEALLRDRGQRMVGINTPGSSFPSVTIDDYGASRTAVQHLINLRHRSIGMITTLLDDPVGFVQTSRRVKAYRDTLSANGLEVDQELLLPGNNSAQGGADAMAIMLSTVNPPTAVFAISDEMAIGAAKTVRDYGLSVPEDVSIVGFDDHDLAPFFGLTTMRQDVADLGARAAAMLESWMRTDERPEDEVAATQLVLRSTTATARPG